jgi:3-oxoacyl-[acyl-carrier protein] reductase
MVPQWYQGAVDLGLSGRPALVAAASKGLGRASALALAAEGARVAICARDGDALEETRKVIAEETGAEVVAVPADVGTEEGALRFVRKGAEALGGCEILVANAGGPPSGEAMGFSDDDIRGAIELNLLSTIRMIREAVPLMRRAGYGRVVVISSSSVKQPVSGLVLSTTARAAAAGWVRHLADEVAPDGITVNTVLPGRIDTDRVRWLLAQRAEREGATPEEIAERDAKTIPMGRIGEPPELGAAVAFLCSERASYITGTFLAVDGGMYRGLL